MIIGERSSFPANGDDAVYKSHRNWASILRLTVAVLPRFSNDTRPVRLREGKSTRSARNGEFHVKLALIQDSDALTHDGL